MNFSTGKSQSFGGKFLEPVAHKLIRYSDEFDDPNLPGEVHVTVNLKIISVGTELKIVRMTYAMSFRWRPAILAGRSCSHFWQIWLKQITPLNIDLLFKEIFVGSNFLW